MSSSSSSQSFGSSFNWNWLRPEIVNCNHDLEVKLVISRKTTNPGRRYYRCPIWNVKNMYYVMFLCDFFFVGISNDKVFCGKMIASFFYGLMRVFPLAKTATFKKWNLNETNSNLSLEPNRWLKVFWKKNCAWELRSVKRWSYNCPWKLMSVKCCRSRLQNYFIVPKF